MSHLLKNLFNTDPRDAGRGAEIVDDQLSAGQAVNQAQSFEQRVPARLAVVHGGGDFDVERIALSGGIEHFHIAGANNACQRFAAEGAVGRE